MQTKYKYYFGIFAGVSTFFIAFSFYFYQMFFTPNLIVSKKEGRYFFIKEGTSFETIADELKKQDFVNDAISFSIVAKLLGYPDKIKSGGFFVKPEMTNLEAIRMFRGGHQKPMKVVISNARLKKDLMGKICKNLSVDSVQLLNMINTPSIAEKYGFDTATIKAMFLPNTYEMYWTIKAEDLLDKFHAEYKKFWTEKRIAQAKEIGLTPIQVAIVASIVDAETQKNDEKKDIAGVYMNRFNQKMKLEADPTVVYAHQDFSIKRVTSKMLKLDSPYNMYMYVGLPPAPINVPATTTIDAVLNYTKHDYLFFCAKEDFSGYHSFAKDFEEHKKNAAKYRQALDKAGY